MDHVRASIIIVVYNGFAYLDHCLTSVSQEVVDGDEIIVVDNASRDGSGELIQQKWSNVKLIRNEVNQGFAAACNQAAIYAAGQYLVFLNQDTRVMPGWLDGLLMGFDANRMIAMTTSKLLLMSKPEKIQTCGRDLHYSGLVIARGLLADKEKYDREATVGAVDGASFAVCKEVWNELGGFDAEFFMYYEETDLSWRAQLAGYRCVYLPASVVYHDARLQPSGLTVYYSNRNRHISLIKNWRWSTLLLLSPGLLLAELASWGETLQQGRPCIDAKLKAYHWFLTNLQTVFQAHERNQAHRRVPDWVILENCAWTLKPVLLTGGILGRVLIKLANIFFYANGWFAMRLCRIMGW